MYGLKRGTAKKSDDIQVIKSNKTYSNSSFEIIQSNYFRSNRIIFDPMLKLCVKASVSNSNETVIAVTIFCFIINKGILKPLLNKARSSSKRKR